MLKVVGLILKICMLIICWDYDGTLVSSELIYKNIFSNYLKKIGVVLKDIEDPNYFSKYAGKHPFNVLEQLKVDGYVDKDIIIDIEKLNLIFQRELKTNNDLLLTNGIINVLENINQHSCVVMAIVTSTCKDDFEAKYNSPSVSILKKYFQNNKNIYICSEVGTKETKPSANGYLFAYNNIIARYKNIKNQKNYLVMIEDSVSGCKSASSAKKSLKGVIDAEVIGYLCKNKSMTAETLRESGADIVIKTSKNLQEYLESLAEKLS